VGCKEAEQKAPFKGSETLPAGDSGPKRDLPNPLLPPVVLPAEKAVGREGTGQIFSVADGERAASREGPRGPGRKHLNIDALQGAVSVEENNRQEWTFTLYGFDHSGKATREDMSSLIHTIYEAVDASVSLSSGGSKTLRVKLTVSPESPCRRKESPPTGQAREPARCGMEAELTEDPRGADKRPSAHTRRPGADPHACCARGPYRVDENTERRNHYLDLAGIENYTSKFGPGAPPVQAKQEHPGKAMHPESRSRSQESDTHTAHHPPWISWASLPVPRGPVTPLPESRPPWPQAALQPLPALLCPDPISSSSRAPISWPYFLLLAPQPPPSTPQAPPPAAPRGVPCRVLTPPRSPSHPQAVPASGPLHLPLPVPRRTDPLSPLPSGHSFPHTRVGSGLMLDRRQRAHSCAKGSRSQRQGTIAAQAHGGAGIPLGSDRIR
uniref:Protein naked cuticle homolog n=1 Tax=Ursus maritimus TaxID=29073 RepID=A0A452VA55_URSMA